MTNNNKPLVAIVGRPNVGKSTFFNKVTGQKLSIVEDTPGVTRDRLYADAEWCGKTFTLMDTGKIQIKSKDKMWTHIKKQATIAIETADVVIFFCDAKTGLTAADYDVADTLRKSGKPIVLAVNKLDNYKVEVLFDFYELGLGQPIGISAEQSKGLGDLLDEVCSYFKPVEENDDGDRLKIAIVGKPNAGKSSLINQIAGEERSLVSDVAGTTRDAIDTRIERDGIKYNFIDTAGLRRKSRVEEKIEKYSVLRAKMAVERADVCVIMIDATEGVTEQDTKVAGEAHNAGKACIIVVNKWDAVEKDGKTMDKMRQAIRADLSYMTYAPIVFISALTGQRVDRIFELINYVNEQATMRIKTGVLNSLLADATIRVQPPTDKGRRLKIYYMTQIGVRPPHFVIFCNDARLFHFSYQRYLENQIRDTFGMEGTPIRLTIRQKGEKEEE